MITCEGKSTNEACRHMATLPENAKNYASDFGWEITEKVRCPECKNTNMFIAA